MVIHVYDRSGTASDPPRQLRACSVNRGAVNQDDHLGIHAWHTPDITKLRQEDQLARPSGLAHDLSMYFEPVEGAGQGEPAAERIGIRILVADDDYRGGACEQRGGREQRRPELILGQVPNAIRYGASRHDLLLHAQLSTPHWNGKTMGEQTSYRLCGILADGIPGRRDDRIKREAKKSLIVALFKAALVEARDLPQCSVRPA
jgi:hypothetical protein